MKMPETYAELVAMSDKDLIEAFDTDAEHKRLGLPILRDELHRRELARSARAMRNLTVVILMLTLANVVLVAISALGR
ncbi:MAG TPA: hypothetical protein VMS99_15315 [Acidimicrobiia bacterium]|nr:hypothetical protein [Acidimicrobiia bacterium]